jgi:stalled ribosome rescue protein Dom34
MTTFHAIVWMDHSIAHVLMFDKEHVEGQRIKARHQHTPKHGHVGADKDFFRQIATSLDGVTEVLLTGPAHAKTEFQAFCREQAPTVDRAVVHVVNSDHPSDAQLVALARQYFQRFDRTTVDPAQR